MASYGTSNDFPTTSGAFDTSYNDGWDAHVTKLNASGSALSYSSYLGGFYYEEARGIAVDAAGSAYVVGHTASNGTGSTAPYPTTAGAYDTSYNGGYDVFVTKMDPSGGSLVLLHPHGRDGRRL